MADIIVPLVGGGIAFYAISKSGDGPAPVKQTPIAPPTEMGQHGAVVNTKVLPKTNSTGWGIFHKPGTGLLDAIGIDQFKTQMDTELTAMAKQKFDQLSESAKKEGAAVLNEKLKINPPLTGKESFKEASSKIGAAAGGAAGAAACAATGLGATVSPLCGIAGAYLGGKYGPAVAEYTKKAVKAAVIKPIKKVGSTLKKIGGKLNPF